MATVAAFPDNTLLGIPYTRYYCSEPEWDGIVYMQTFEDKSGSFNSVTTTPSQIWELTWDGLTAYEASALDAHYDLALGQLHDFSFTDREGTTHTGVRYASDGFKRDHTKQWIQSRKIKLILRP